MAIQYKLLVAAGSTVLSTQMTNYANEGWIEIGNHQVTHYLDKNDKDVFQYSMLMAHYGPTTKDVEVDE